MYIDDLNQDHLGEQVQKIQSIRGALEAISGTIREAVAKLDTSRAAAE